MKKIAACICALFLIAACASSPQGFKAPETWSELKASELDPGPGREGYMFAVGAAATLPDQCGVLNNGTNGTQKYACLAIQFGQPVEFPCPCKP